MRNISTAALAIAVAISFTAAAASAKLGSSDRKLMEKLGQGDSSEVELAKIVKPNTEHAGVKDFAQKMIDDHSKAFSELDKIADAEKAPLKSGMDAEHKKFAAKLAKEKHGLPYDRTYIDEMVKDHKKDKSDVEKAIKEIKDPTLKHWAENELKTVEEHLKLAEELHAKVK